MVLIKETATARITDLDEVELCIGLLKINHPELIEKKTYKQIANSLNDKFGINTTEEDVFLLHEPSIDDLEEDLRIQFEAMNLIY